MNLTLRSIRDFFVSSLYTLYDNREAQAITHFYFEQKWGIAPQEFALRQDAFFPREQMQESEKDLQRLQKGEPVQYVVGHAFFYDLTLEVNPLVLIPRPETEELIQILLQQLSTPSPSNCGDAVCHKNTMPPVNTTSIIEHHVPPSDSGDTVGHGDTTRFGTFMRPADTTGKAETPATPCRILDCCTGSGAIAIAIAKHLPQADVTATDYSADILELAQRNAKNNHVVVRWLKHDLLHDGAEPLNGPYHAIVSNPPYIPQSRRSLLHKNVADHEPAEALFVPDDKPLLFYERIALLGQELLADNGLLFFETHEDFHDELEALLLQHHYQDIKKLSDLNGKPRFVTCKK